MLATGAFDACAVLGLPQLPLVKERTIGWELLPLAAGAGCLAAQALLEGSGQTSLRCLGTLQITKAGRALVLPPGRPTTAVIAVAAAGGSLHAEELIEMLWPEADVDTGRARLRNVMSRVKAVAGDLLERRGDLVALGPDVELDLTEFEREANEAMALSATHPARAAAVARTATARYRGSAVQQAQYETWAVSVRERLRLLYLGLLDILATDAERNEEIDEAVRLLARAIDVEPYYEDRYVRAACFCCAHRVAPARPGRCANVAGPHSPSSAWSRPGRVGCSDKWHYRQAGYAASQRLPDPASVGTTLRAGRAGGIRTRTVPFSPCLALAGLDRERYWRLGPGVGGQVVRSLSGSVTSNRANVSASDAGTTRSPASRYAALTVSTACRKAPAFHRSVNMSMSSLRR